MLLCCNYFHNGTAAHVCVQICADWHLPLTERRSLRNHLQCENEIPFSRRLLLVDVRYCGFHSGKHAKWTQRVILEHSTDVVPPRAWFLFSFRASSCMISRLHTISLTLIVTNYTLKRGSSSTLAACDVSRQQEQRCVPGFLRARYQVAGRNKSIMWSWGSSLKPVPRGLHPELEMSQIQTTTALRGMWPGKNPTKTIWAAGCQTEGDGSFWFNGQRGTDWRAEALVFCLWWSNNVIVWRFYWDRLHKNLFC